QVMRLLAGRIERVTVARGIVIAKIGARLDRVGREPVVLKVERDDLGRRSHRRLRPLAISALDLEHEVVSELRLHQHPHTPSVRRRVLHRPPRAAPPALSPPPPRPPPAAGCSRPPPPPRPLPRRTCSRPPPRQRYRRRDGPCRGRRPDGGPRSWAARR